MVKWKTERGTLLNYDRLAFQVPKENEHITVNKILKIIAFVQAVYLIETGEGKTANKQSYGL